MRRLLKEFLAVFGGTDAIHLPEYTSKVLLGFESASYCNIQHTHLGTTQNLLGMLNSMAQDKLVWRFASSLAKHL